MEDDQEIKAMADVISSLEGLDAVARERVLKYVTERLGITALRSAPHHSADLTPPPASSVKWAGAAEPIAVGGSVKDIRSLKEQKNPETAIQMATLVAYYLQEIAAGDEKKDSITVGDIQTYFKQAGFALPKIPKSALINAKTAGYLESADRGSYRLNPVGYNLVAHGLPAKSGGKGVAKRAKKKTQKTKKKK